MSEGGQELLTDLYELTMLQAYFAEGMDDVAVFDLFVRKLPEQRNFLVAAGLEQVLGYLEGLSFSAGSIAFLDSLGLFTAGFLDYLSRLRFTGDVRAMPEGTIAFGMEPLVVVSAPMPQAQLIETYLLNQVTFQTMIASKGARAVLTAGGRTLVDFGSRRAHGSDAALKAARALYIAGYASTSNVLAGQRYGIPVAGTMAHSYIQAHDSEEAAFRAFLRSYPETVLLLDTYDTEEAARLVVRLSAEGPAARIRGVRLDSGDMAALARGVRITLDDAGMERAAIFASGGLDEYEIAELLAAGAPISAFGVGTSAVVSSDAPSLDSVYKLAAYAGRPRMKLAAEKSTLPGAKQVFRRHSGAFMAGDTIALAGEAAEGTPLLVEVMRGGRRTDAGRETLAAVRERTRAGLEALAQGLRGLSPAETPYAVAISPGLERERDELQRQLQTRDRG